MSKILVTGGCGYIGSHTIIELIRNNYDVISIDNFSNSSPDVLDKIKLITGVDVVNYNIDLCSELDIIEVFKENIDIVGVIHFAALKSVPESINNPILYYKNNIQSLLNLINTCKIFNINNFIFSSSCSVYGDVELLPVNEDTKLSKPLSPYAHTKIICEEIIKFTSGYINFTILRYFNPVGADISGLIGEYPKNIPTSLVPIITQTAIGIRDEILVYGGDYNTRDGSCVRDYVHVSDIALAHIKAFEFNKVNKGVEVFNLGSGKGVSVLEAIRSFEFVSGVKVNYRIVDRRIGDVVDIYSDSSKAENILGWIPKYNIEDMMLSSWKWQCQIKKS